jgi:acetylornithine/succinyldiaminopimelate/putrescine aminotransferase
VPHPYGPAPQTNPAWLAAHQTLIAETGERFPVAWASASGSRLIDVEGHEYLDFFGGHAVMALGYAHPAQLAAMQGQLAAFPHIGNHFVLPAQVGLAGRLLAGSFAEKVMYANCGAETVELAFKLARRFKSAASGVADCRILSMENSFHGRSYGALSATGQEKYRRAMGPFLPGIERVPFNDGTALSAAMGDDVAAVLLEVIQGDGGVVPATGEFLATARRLCDRHGALLIFDEIQTGLGRCGTKYAYQGTGTTPDVLLLGKALGGGLPLSALLTTDRIAAVLSVGDHGSTFGGNPVAAAGGIVLLDLLDDPAFLAGIGETSRQLFSGLEDLQARHPERIRAVRGRGLLAGIELSNGAKQAVQAALDRGLLINNPVGEVLRLMPALNIGRADLEEGLARLGEILGR